MNRLLTGVALDLKRIALSALIRDSFGFGIKTREAESRLSTYTAFASARYITSSEYRAIIRELASVTTRSPRSVRDAVNKSLELYGFHVASPGRVTVYKSRTGRKLWIVKYSQCHVSDLSREWLCYERRTSFADAIARADELVKDFERKAALQ